MISTGRRRMRRADIGRRSEPADNALLVARQIYSRRVATGWLEEEEYGLRVTVDMRMGSLLSSSGLRASIAMCPSASADWLCRSDLGLRRWPS
jgi:hypothetical protein